MSETIDDINIDWFDEENKQIVKQLKKEVLTRGSWTTIVFMYQERNRQTDEFGPPKIRVGRYQKRSGKFMPQSKFNISSVKQAKQIQEILGDWMGEMESLTEEVKAAEEK